MSTTSQDALVVLPQGRHARPGGLWYDPVPWALIVSALNWILLIWRQAPCRQYDYGQIVNPFLRLCYSDIPVIYQGRGIATGSGLYSQVGLEYPVVTGYFIMLNRKLVEFFGGQVDPLASGQQQLDASYLFFVFCAIGLFCCFLATVAAHILMGKNSASFATRGIRVRSFDALLIAAAPVVLADGLINWDILAVALSSLAILAWSRKHPAIAGVLAGLGFATKFYPILIVLAIFLVCLRADKMRAFLSFIAGFAGAWLVVNLPVMITAPSGWAEFWTQNFTRSADLGSLWYLMDLLGLTVPGLNMVVAVLMLAGFGYIASVVLRAPRRPRLGQVVFLLLVVFLVCNKVYSPQYALWLLPFMVLARPKLFDWAIWNLAEVLYWLAIWGFLEGILGIGSGADMLYWLAIIVRIGVQIWLAIRVIRDIMRPWDDPLRQGLSDDPIGGVVDHAPDARWLQPVKAPARRAEPALRAEPAPGSA